MYTDPRYRQEQSPLPPIGFNADVLGQASLRPGSALRTGRSGSNIDSWDTTRDLVFMRVLSADEFLGRMDETDEQINSWATCYDNPHRYFRIKELLGLRGHLQDELLRIEFMLAKDDPDLQCLRDFEGEFSRVVQRLRDLHETSKNIHIESIDIGIDTDDVPIESTVLPVTQMPIRSSSDSSSNTDTPTATATQDTHKEEIHEHLRRKFVAEEEHVAGDFAEKLSRTDQILEQEDIDRLLNDHAISMQALRKKQNIEKDKYKQLLETKKRERLLNRRPCEEPLSEPVASTSKKSGEVFFVDFAPPSTSKPKGVKSKISRKGTSLQSDWFHVDMNRINSSDKKIDSVMERQGTFTKTETSQSIEPVCVVKTPGAISVDAAEESDKPILTDTDIEDIQSEYEDDFDEEDSDIDDKEELKTTLKDDLWVILREQDEMSKETFQDLLNTYREQEEDRTATKDSQKLKHKSSLLAKLAERNNKNKANGKEMQTQTDVIKTTSMSMGTEDPFDVEQISIKDADDNLIKKLVSLRRTMTDNDFQQLLNKHLADIEQLRKQRALDQAKLKEKLRERLSKKMQKERYGSESECEDDEDYIAETLTIEEFHSDDDHLQQELTALDEKLQKELQRRGKNVDESDLSELMEHYRRQQEALIKQRRGEQAKLKDKLHNKLHDRKGKECDRGDCEKLDGEGKDESFFNELQIMQKHGNLTEEQFSLLMRDYLNQDDKDKKKERLMRKERTTKRHELDRNAASTLVHTHHEQTAQIKGIRQREKDIMDQRLKKKLNSKKNKIL